MTTRQAPRTYVALSITALICCGAWCASALASNDVQAPSPELVALPSASLDDILDEAVNAPRLRASESSDIVTLPGLADAGTATEEMERSDSDASIETLFRNNEFPAIAARLPGVSAADLPRFRRYMFRTDI